MSAHNLNLNVYKAELTVRAGDLKKILGTVLESGRRERSLRLLRQIEYALLRLARGRYGECVKCERHVERKLLDMTPWAIFCGNCQRIVDRLQADAQARRNAFESPA